MYRTVLYMESLDIPKRSPLTSLGLYGLDPSPLFPPEHTPDPYLSSHVRPRLVVSYSRQCPKSFTRTFGPRHQDFRQWTPVGGRSLSDSSLVQVEVWVPTKVEGPVYTPSNESWNGTRRDAEVPVFYYHSTVLTPKYPITGYQWTE